MAFLFIDQLSANSTTLSLKWEKLSIPIKIDVDVNTTVIASMQKELTGIRVFSGRAGIRLQRMH